MEKQQLRRNVRERVARGITRTGEIALNGGRDDKIERERGKMQRIDTCESTPQEAADGSYIVDLAEILACDHEAGDDEKQIHEEIEVLRMFIDEMAGSLVFHII